MKQLIIFISVLLVVGLGVAGLILVFVPKKQNNSLSTPQVNLNQTGEEVKEPQKIKPSETDIEYVDPAGFSFSYPDNLSISKAEINDPSTYADLLVSSKEISGSLNLKITDSKFKSLDDWLKINQISASNTPKETKLGTFKAQEVKTADRLLLGALDQGVLFTIEMPLVEQDFWMKVYNKILADFTFVSPETKTSSQISNSSSDVIFEGEELVE